MTAQTTHILNTSADSADGANPPGPKAATVSSWTLGTSPQKMAWQDGVIEPK